MTYQRQHPGSAGGPGGKFQISNISNFKYFKFQIGALALLLLFAATSASHAEPPPREYQIRAVFLLHFAQFTEWPADAFTNREEPLIIGVLGSNPFGTFLSETVSNETVQGRPLALALYNRVEEIKSCHILYIGQSEAERLSRVVSVLRNKPVLTVSDIEGADERGVIIRFEKDHNRIKLAFNLQASKTARLNVSSKLLRLVKLTDSRK